MASIGFSCHFERRQALDLAHETAEWLIGAGHDAVVLPQGDGLVGTGEGGLSPQEALGKLDLMVSLGGDGTMLHTVGLMLEHGVPVMGVNFGRFGYLTAVEPDGLRHAIERFLGGDYSLDRRITLDCGVMARQHDKPRALPSSLNDIVLSRPSGTHTINARVSISGHNFLSYAADAMIISTPTGSTGYNLSARGPIVSPGLRCLVLTPVAPHMLFDRSVVLDQHDEVVIELHGRCPADLIVDGRSCGQLEVGERLVCRAGAQDAMLVNFGDRKFETVLKSKFHLTDR